MFEVDVRSFAWKTKSGGSCQAPPLLVSMRCQAQQLLVVFAPTVRFATVSAAVVRWRSV
jgi:hypothetical protein